jgi:hypothetical protein
MRLLFVLTIGYLLVSTLVASSQDKGTSLPQTGYVGKWTNATREGPKTFTRFVVSKKDDDWWIEAWLNLGGGNEATMGKVSLSLLGDNVQAKSLSYGFATWKGEPTVHLTLRLEKDQVVAETFTIYKDKSSGASNFRRQEKFKKK